MYSTLTCYADTTENVEHDNLKAARAYLAEEMKWENTKWCMITDRGWNVTIEHNP